MPLGEADDDDAPLEGDDLGGLSVGLAADRVVDDVGAPAAGGLLDGGDDVLGAPVDHDVAAQFTGDGRFRGAADDTDDGGADGLPELHGRTADPSCGSVDEQGLAGLQTGPAVQSEPAGLVPDVQGRGLRVVQGVRRGQQGRGIGDGVLGEAAVGQCRVGDHAAAVLGLAADLHAGGEGQRRPDLVLAPAQQGVREVDVRGAHPQQDLAVAGHRSRHVRQAQHLARLAVLVHLPCLHAGPPRDCFV